MSYRIEVSIKQQHLYLYHNEKLQSDYLISSGLNGVGERMGSEKTPRGQHQIRAKIGKDQPENMVFYARRPTGEIATPEFVKNNPRHDWIVTRILWLSGLEPGKNRFGQVDTAKRKIYIHGTPDHSKLGKPRSRGCIQMANHDIMELFDIVPAGTLVFIRE